MWSSRRPVERAWNAGRVQPTEVLYEFDGPAVFAAMVGLSRFLFLKKQEGEESDCFLAAEVSIEKLEALKSGRISLRGALDSSMTFIIEADLDYNVVAYQRLDSDEVEDCLPPRGLALYSKFGEVPDSLEQANALLAFKFESDLMQNKSMPLSMLKSLIDDVSDVARKVIIPQVLMIGKLAREFELMVSPPKFSSLLIAIESAKIDRSALLKAKWDGVLDETQLADEAERLSGEFLLRLDRVRAIAEKSELSLTDANTHSDVLFEISDILPSDSNELRRLQISHQSKTGFNLISIDKEVGERLSNARKLIETPSATIRGIIIEVNDESNTFVVKSLSGRQVTIKPRLALYSEMVQAGRNKTGTHVTVSGRYTRRVRRDLLVPNDLPSSVVFH